MIETSWKSTIQRVIDSHFPPIISMRFSLRSDSEVFIPKEDEAIWTRWKKENENMHVFFDGTELLEIPFHMGTSRKKAMMIAEYFILRRFKEAIENNEIDIEKKPDLVENSYARKRKREIQKEKKKKFDEAVKFAIQTTPKISKKKVSLSDELQVTKLSLGGE